MTKRIDNSELKMGVVLWQQDDEFSSLLADTLEDLGYQTISLLPDAKLPDYLDVVFALGPFGSLVLLADQLFALPPSRRPLFVLWMTEQFPNPDLPEWIRYFGGILRSKVERLVFREQTPSLLKINSALHWLTTKAYRYRYYGDLFWLQQNGLLSVLVVTSQWTADFLRARGFDPIIAYDGYSPKWGKDLGLKRDIPVLWLGKIGSKRRERILTSIRTGLRNCGIEILIIDGVENPYIFGDERTILLNRTKIVLNIMRNKWDDNSMRYFLAAPNRALIVTEPTLRHTPFIHGQHFVEAPVEQIPDTIRYYLSHEEEWKQITDQAYQLITTDLTFKGGVRRILDYIRSKYDKI